MALPFVSLCPLCLAHPIQFVSRRIIPPILDLEMYDESIWVRKIEFKMWYGRGRDWCRESILKGHSRSRMRNGGRADGRELLEAGAMGPREGTSWQNSLGCSSKVAAASNTKWSIGRATVRMRRHLLLLLLGRGQHHQCNGPSAVVGYYCKRLIFKCIYKDWTTRPQFWLKLQFPFNLYFKNSDKDKLKSAESNSRGATHLLLPSMLNQFPFTWYMISSHLPILVTPSVYKIVMGNPANKKN